MNQIEQLLSSGEYVALNRDLLEKEKRIKTLLSPKEMAEFLEYSDKVTELENYIISFCLM